MFNILVYIFIFIFTGDFSWVKVFANSSLSIVNGNNNTHISVLELNNTYFSIQSLKQVIITNVNKLCKELL